MSTIEKTKESVSTKSKRANKYQIILFNDEVNTFEHVIESLIKVCDHNLEQAEQCAMITHYNGKCGVKTGSFKELKSQCSKLLELALSASIK